MSFTDTLKAVLTTAFLAGSAAVLAAMTQRSALRTVACLQVPDESEAGA